MKILIKIDVELDTRIKIMEFNFWIKKKKLKLGNKFNSFFLEGFECYGYLFHWLNFNI